MASAVPELSLIIPAYDEAERLPAFLRAARAYLQRELGDAWEILVVDDGSRDATARVVAEELGEAALVRLPANRGKGAAVRAGMLAARGKLRLFADADGATPIEEEKALRRAIEAGAQVAIGSRAAHGGKRIFLREGQLGGVRPSAVTSRAASGVAKPDAAGRPVTWHVLPHRHVTGRMYSLLVRALVGLDVCDSQCGFKMFTAAAATSIFGASRIDDFSFDVEALCLARDAGLEVKEVPVNWREMAGSKVDVRRDALKMLRSILALRRRLGLGAGRPLAFAAACLALLALMRALPLEHETSGLGGRLLFMLKSTVAFLALAPALYGWGRGLHALVRSCLRVAGVAVEPSGDPWRPTAVLLQLLAGLVAAGTATFLLGTVAPPHPWHAALVVAIGLSALVLGRPLRLADARGATALAWHRLGRMERGLAALLLTLTALRLSSVFAFQGHEDAYLYHLELAEAWLRDGRTGILLSNIYSGYALAVEHYYLLLKLLFVGNAEQNALAQMSQALIGFGGFVAGLDALGRRLLATRERLALGLSLLQPVFLAFFVLPKNDGLLAAAGVLAVAAVADGAAGAFATAAAVALAIKPTAPLGFTAIGLAMLALGLPRLPTGRRGVAVLLGAAALLMLTVWLPFGLSALVRTGNPLFPLLNHLFGSPFAPTSLAQVVQEMRPLSMSAEGYLRAFGKLLAAEPLYAAAAALALAGLAWRGRGALRQLAGEPAFRLAAAVALAAFVVLQLAMGEFGGLVEHRHFLLVLGPLLVVAGAVLFRVAGSWGAAAAALAVIGLAGLARSSVDVDARRFVESLRHDNLTDALFAQKPVIRLNHGLAKEPGPVRMLALSTTNTGYFLASGEFWHPSMTWPVWSWNVKALSTAEWREHIASHAITHVLVESNARGDYAPLLRLPLDRVDQVGAYTVYRVSPRVAMTP
jgi:dolichyl-phosphate beta-glucosyltransferase